MILYIISTLITLAALNASLFINNKFAYSEYGKYKVHHTNFAKIAYSALCFIPIIGETVVIIMIVAGMDKYTYKFNVEDEENSIVKWLFK